MRILEKYRTIMGVYRRTIMKTGPKSRGITLPKPWIDHQNLTTEDSLIITEEDGSLKIETDRGDEGDE